jgi:SAM-dependent methyltransferase
MTDWNERYLRGEHLHDDPHPVVTRFAGSMAVGRALDVACGAGRHAIWLAERGWDVTAVDASRAAIDILRSRAEEKALAIETVVADLERAEFTIQPEFYDLIVVCNYLQRDLFPAIRAGVRSGGAAICIVAMTDDDPDVKPMNPRFLLGPGELRSEFSRWKILHDFEGKPSGVRARRATAEIVAIREMLARGTEADIF